MTPFSTDPDQAGVLKFKLFGVPVGIHWMFWLVIAILGPIETAKTPLGVQVWLIWVAVGLVSILVHEFGHAFAFRKFGGRPAILLYGMGGLAKCPGGRFSRNQNIVITLGGPVFGLVLGLAVWAVAKWLVPPAASDSVHLYFLILYLLWINIGWSLINLLPIHPLDGGQLLGHIMHQRRPELRAKIGMGCAIAIGVALFALSGGKSIFPLLLFGYLAYMNYQRIGYQFR